MGGGTLASCKNAVNAGNTPAAKDLKAMPQVGSIIMKDGSLKTATDITAADRNDAVAVVYKV